MKLSEEQLASISGGDATKELSEQDREEFEQWADVYLEENFKRLRKDPAFNQERLGEATRALEEMNERFNQKYGKWAYRF